MSSDKPYDGFYKYDKVVASSYETDRFEERHWKQEDKFVRNYLASTRINKLLDLPVGTGRFLPLYGRVKDLVGVDISEDMLREARAKGRPTPAGGTTKLEKGDVVALPFDTKFFDITIVCRLFHLIPEAVLPKAIAELCRVTRMDLVVQSYIPTHEGTWTLSDKFNAYLSRSAAKRIAPPTAKSEPVSRPWFHIQSYNHERSVFEELFRSAGFRVHKTKLIDVYGPTDVRMTVYRRA